MAESSSSSATSVPSPLGPQHELTSVFSAGVVPSPHRRRSLPGNAKLADDDPKAIVRRAAIEKHRPAAISTGRRSSHGDAVATPKSPSPFIDPRSPRDEILAQKVNTKQLADSLRALGLSLENNPAAIASSKQKRLQEKLDHFKSLLQTGVQVTKYVRNKAPEEKLLQCDAQMHTFTSSGKTSFHANDLVDVKSGIHTPELSQAPADSEHLCFSVFTNHRSFDFQVSSQHDRDLLVEGFEILIYGGSRRPSVSPDGALAAALSTAHNTARSTETSSRRTGLFSCCSRNAGSVKS
eukprot:GILI01017257.1.p1 GENE.GILI01017257.1~~GILI01017257.1.p1  ORF type:complete len:294 (-),score=40.36 GILI01017257.1:218-1099(-)